MKSKLLGVFSDELLKLETLPGPLLVDNMNNESSRAYGSFPDRLYIVLNEKIVYMVCIFLHSLLVILFLLISFQSSGRSGTAGLQCFSS